jgi:hypothetical protein
MGEKKRRSERFRSANPTCCFCGGQNDTETIDHQPAAIFFDGRQRPKGLEVPACRKCNNRTGKSEQVAALVARLYPDPVGEESEKETKSLFRAIRNNNPGLLEEMVPTVRDQRRFMRDQLGLIPGIHGTPSEVRIINASGPILADAMADFGKKMALALHYHHTKIIVPSAGWINVRWYPNAQVQKGTIPKEFLDLLEPHAITLRAGSFSVEDQFSYRIACSNDGNLSAFYASFRLSFALIGMVACEPTDDFAVDGSKSFHPFSWP